MMDKRDRELLEQAQHGDVDAFAALFEGMRPLITSVAGRLVRATNSGASNPQGINDVIGVLKGSLPYRSFSLVASGGAALPNGRASLGGYTVECRGPSSKLSITVRKGSRAVLNTSVRLVKGRPLIVGGFPEGDGKLVLVFVLR